MPSARSCSWTCGSSRSAHRIWPLATGPWGRPPVTWLQQIRSDSGQTAGDALNCAQLRRTCRTTAFRTPVSTLGSTCVLPTVNCLQYLAIGSTLTAVGPFQLPAPKSGTLSRISSGTRPSVQTVSDVCLKRTCSLDTSAFSALEVLDDNRAL